MHLCVVCGPSCMLCVFQAVAMHQVPGCWHALFGGLALGSAAMVWCMSSSNHALCGCQTIATVFCVLIMNSLASLYCYVSLASTCLRSRRQQVLSCVTYTLNKSSLMLPRHQSTSVALSSCKSQVALSPVAPAASGYVCARSAHSFPPSMLQLRSMYPRAPVRRAASGRLSGTDQ